MASDGKSLGGVDLWVAFGLYLVLGLVSGGLVEYVVEHKLPRLPFTVAVFFMGAITAVAFLYSIDSKSPPREFISQSALVSELILYLFLPVLIFGETMQLNWHRAMRALNQSMWLAGPGVVISTMLTAAAAMYFNDWSFQASCVFGAILSATDPVAVVALLKSTGAPQDLTMLIVGESLLNDGSVIFMYQLFLRISQQAVGTSFVGLLEFFFENALGSVCFGTGVGLVANIVMRKMDNPLKKLDMTTQCAITVAACYISFVVAQYSLDISGVLSSSAAGLIVARFAPPFILHHRVMHRVWGVLEWCANALIFFFAGLSAADRAAQYCRPTDIYRVIVMYLTVMLVRAVLIAFLYPVLARGPLLITARRCFFMQWSGLRGALAIALVLNLSAGSTFQSKVQQEIFIQVIGVVALTLLVNGTTSKVLLERLQLSDKYVEDEDLVQLMKTLVVRQMTKAVDLKLLEASSSSGVSVENLADKYCSFLNSSSVMSARDTFSIKRDMRKRGPGPAGQKMRNTSLTPADRANLLWSASTLVGPARLSVAPTPSAAPPSSPSSPSSPSARSDPGHCDPYLIAFLRKRFYDALGVQYRQYVQIGKIPRSSYAAHVLLFSLDAAYEQAEDEICDWSFTQRHMEGSATYLKVVKALDNFCLRAFGCVAGLYSLHLSSLDKRIVYIVSNFIDAHIDCQKKIPTFLGGDAGSGSPPHHGLNQQQKETGAGGAQSHQNHSNSSGQQQQHLMAEEAAIREESMAVVKLAREYLSRRFNATALREFWEQSAARIVLHEQREILLKMVNERVLSRAAAEDLLVQIEKDGYQLEEKRMEMHREFVKARVLETNATMKKVQSGGRLSLAVEAGAGAGAGTGAAAGENADSIPSPLHEL